MSLNVGRYPVGVNALGRSVHVVAGAGPERAEEVGQSGQLAFVEAGSSEHLAVEAVGGLLDHGAAALGDRAQDPPLVRLTAGAAYEALLLEPVDRRGHRRGMHLQQ